MTWKIIFFSISYLCVGYSQDLIVIPSGKQTKGLGEDLVLTCKLVGSIDPIGIILNIQWYDITGIEILDKSAGRDNTPYVDKSIPQTSKLYLKNIQSKHAGTYSCSAVIGGNRESVNVSLEVLREITIENAPSEQYPQLYTDATILCKVTGQPNPEVFWRFKGQRISGGRYSQNLYGLIIKNITEEDNGLYECSAEIETLGIIHIIQINVIVRVPPRIISFNDFEGISSQEFAIFCNATSLPPAKFDFNKDGNPQVVFSTDRIMVDRDGGQIFFRPLIPEDAGSYQCKAFNDVGEDVKTAKLNVVVPPKIYSVRNVTQTEGLKISLVCLTFGDPDPEMTFKRAGLSQEYIMGSNDGGRIMLVKPGPRELDLIIYPLKWDDTANYTCIARNKGGFHMWNGTITVQFVPRFSPEMPLIVYNWAGKTRNLTCLIFSEPKPSIDWYRLGQRLQNNETFKIHLLDKNSNLQVTIRQVDEYYIYGDYVCRAINLIGQNQITIQMKRSYLPGAPQAATVVRSTPTSLELVVIPPTTELLYGLPLFGIWVQCENRILEFLLGEKILIEYLRPSNTYEILIRARTEIGIGDILRINGQTLDISVPYPIIVNSDPRSNFPFEYTVTWIRPETGGLPIREYQFRIREVSVQPGTFKLNKAIGEWKRRIKNVDISYPSMFYRIQGLISDTYYQLEVLALNDVGWSTASPEFIFRTNFDPMIEDDYKEDNSATTVNSKTSDFLIPVFVVAINHIFTTKFLTK